MKNTELNVKYAHEVILSKVVDALSEDLFAKINSHTLGGVGDMEWKFPHSADALMQYIKLVFETAKDFGLTYRLYSTFVSKYIDESKEARAIVKYSGDDVRILLAKESKRIALSACEDKAETIMSGDFIDTIGPRFLTVEQIEAIKIEYNVKFTIITVNSKDTDCAALPQ